MNRRYGQAVERVTRVAGVRGVLLVDGEAGVPVVSELSEGINETALAALAAALFRRTATASETSDFGRLHTLQLEAEAGHVVAADAGDLIMVVVAERDAPLGLVRLEARRAVETLV